MIVGYYVVSAALSFSGWDIRYLLVASSRGVGRLVYYQCTRKHCFPVNLDAFNICTVGAGSVLSLLHSCTLSDSSIQ